MQFKTLVKTVIAASVLASATAQALPLSEYNLIVEEDYSHASSVWGRTFVGGNMVSNGGEFGTRLDRSVDLPSLSVVGNISGGNINMMAGSLEYGGSLANTVSFNGAGSAYQTDQAALAARGAGMIGELKSASSNYAGKSATGNLVRNNNNATFQYTGAGSVAYFDVNAYDVFSQNSLLQMDMGSATSAIINISVQDLAKQGQASAFDFLTQGGINFGNGFNEQTAGSILWNFYDAKNLDLQDLKMRGSVLAMSANLLSIGTIDGSIAAKSFVQDSQVHNYTFTPPSEVPLPASVQFMLMGLGGLFAARWYRRRKAAQAA